MLWLNSLGSLEMSPVLLTSISGIPMDAISDPFKRANYLIRKAHYTHWHRTQSKQQILRSQLGFNDIAFSRPKACVGCENYHGVAYGHRQETRTVLVCGIHAYGWQEEMPCPDWTGRKASSNQ